MTADKFKEFVDRINEEVRQRVAHETFYMVVKNAKDEPIHLLDESSILAAIRDFVGIPRGEHLRRIVKAVATINGKCGRGLIIMR
eukprot:scaffold12329_cov84-Amphora_coffeaeformis.AAC.1